MRKNVPNDLLSKKARKLLMELYERLDNWEKVARRCGLANRTQAWGIAVGKLRPTPAMINYMAKKKNLRGPKKLLKGIRRIAVKFLQARTPAISHCYVRGGKPYEQPK